MYISVSMVLNVFVYLSTLKKMEICYLSPPTEIKKKKKSVEALLISWGFT